MTPGGPLMPAFYAAVAVVIAIKLIPLLIRAFRGPTVFDRLAAVGVIGTTTIVFILLMGLITGRLDQFVDIAIAYGALAFVAFLLIAKYMEHKGDYRE